MQSNQSYWVFVLILIWLNNLKVRLDSSEAYCIQHCQSCIALCKLF